MPSRDPATEIRLHSVRVIQGANFWSRSPVVTMELGVGAYEDISSANVPGLKDALVRVLPGLIEHRCSIGERGGFLARLKRGTYAPHIIEHVALELQNMIGHDVGFGRSRGGEGAGQYTVVFAHLHSYAGPLAAACALDIVQRGFAGTLHTIDDALEELRAVSRIPDEAPQLQREILCAITGGSGRAETRDEMARRGVDVSGQVIDVAPAQILEAGLPYIRARTAVILDSNLDDVPERYRAPDHAERLLGTVAEAVVRGGMVVVPAKEWALQDLARDAGCVVSVFATDEDITIHDTKVAHAAAWVSGGRIVLEWRGELVETQPLHDAAPAHAQVAALLAVACVQRAVC